MGVEDCQWFTLEKANDHCILYEECDDQFDCETCATGEKKCAHGYHGTTPAPPKANKDGSAVIVKVTQSSRWANAWTGTRLIDGKGLDGRWGSQACAATSDAYRPSNLVDGYEFFSLELEAPQKKLPESKLQTGWIVVSTEGIMSVSQSVPHQSMIPMSHYVYQKLLNSRRMPVCKITFARENRVKANLSK